MNQNNNNNTGLAAQGNNEESGAAVFIDNFSNFSEEGGPGLEEASMETIGQF